MKKRYSYSRETKAPGEHKSLYAVRIWKKLKKLNAERATLRGSNGNAIRTWRSATRKFGESGKVMIKVSLE